MNKISSWVKVPMDSLKETSWSAIIVFSVLYCFYIPFLNFAVFKLNILQPISEATQGLVNQTLIANLISIIIFALIIILMYGRLGLGDIGIKKNRLLAAAAAIAVIWISMQLINIVIGMILSGRLVINGEWKEYGVTRMLGGIISQLFGNCLIEEIAFRGFLLVQIYKKLKDKKRRLIASVGLSQLLFAVIHIPSRIMGGMNALEILPSLIIVFFIGVLFAAIYLLTDNIFLAIGIHALWNTPLLVFSGIPGVIVVFAAAVILPIMWDRSLGRLGSKPMKSDMDYRV